MTYWTIIYDPTGDNVEKSLADWNIKDAKINIVESGLDTMTFTQFGVDMDDDLSFDEFKTCIVMSGRVTTDGLTYTGGKIRFQAIVVAAPRYGQGDSEYIRYRLAGPWWFFENQTMEIPFQVTTGGTLANPTFTTMYSSHFILGRNIFGGPITTGESIQQCVQYVIGLGAPIALLANVTVAVPNIPGVNNGTISASGGIKTYMYFPVDEVNTITVAQCIKQISNWTPDMVTWFDYSTNPPTFMCQSPSGVGGGLTPVNIQLFGSDLGDVKITSAEIVKRVDLLKTFVWFKFEQVNTINGQQKYNLSNNIYPPLPLPTGIDGFRGVTQTVTLSGASFNTVTAALKTIPVPDLTGSSITKTWLKGRANWLNDDSIMQITIGSVKNPDGSGFTSAFPFIVVGGSVASWMKGAGGAAAQSARQTAVFTIDVNRKNGETIVNQTVQVEITSCNIDTNSALQTFTNTSGSPSDDFVPPNIAEDYYKATNVLQWDGEITISQTEADAGIGVGNALNIIDSPAFANMDATVRGITIDIEKGDTVVKIGPNKLRTLGTLIDLLRVTRSRLVTMSPTVGSDGNFGSGDTLALPDHFPTGQASGGEGFKNAMSASDTNDGSVQQVLITAVGTPSQPQTAQLGITVQVKGDALISISYYDLFVPGIGKMQAKFRTYDVCVTDANGNSTVQQCLLLGTLPFPKT